jgi:hypothetical protein
LEGRVPPLAADCSPCRRGYRVGGEPGGREAVPLPASGGTTVASQVIPAFLACSSCTRGYCAGLVRTDRSPRRFPSLGVPQ